MILFHPLNKQNEVNKKAIDKYKDRIVRVKIAKFNLWLDENNKWNAIDRRASITFKSALKITKSYIKSDGIEYHFKDIIGDAKSAEISEFDQDEIWNCNTIVFEYK